MIPRTKTYSVFLILFAVLMCFSAAAAADTNYATNGDFSQGTTGWTITKDYVTSVSESGYSIVSVTQHTGTTGNALKMELYPRPDSHASVTASQTVAAGGITTIKFWYKYQATSSQSGYDSNLPEFDVYWGGQRLGTIDCYYGSETSWDQKTYTIPNGASAAGGLTFQATAYAQSSSERDRYLVFYIDDVEILSTNVAPNFGANIPSQSPATSAASKAPSPATITFTAPALTAGNPAPTYTWSNTYDGTTGTGNTFTMQFPYQGTFTVTCTATNAAGSASASCLVYIDASLPGGEFVGSPTSGSAPLNVIFQPTSYNDGDTFQWWFGDGNPVNQSADSTAISPNHRYTTEGDYTVTLTQTNAVGSKTVTKNQYIHVDPEGTTTVSTGMGSIYSPNSVRLLFMTSSGAPAANMSVTITQSGQVGVLSNILALFGLQSGGPVTGTQSGTTGSDGSLSFLGLPQLEYTITFTWNNVEYSNKIYPKESTYTIRINDASAAVQTANPATWWNNVSTDYRTVQLHMTYYAANTTSVFVWAKQDDEIFFSQNLIGSRAEVNLTVANTRGVTYEWGYTATMSDSSTVTDSRSIGATGNPDSPLWSLGFEDNGISTDWYLYIALGIMILTGALFSVATTRQGAVVVALFEGGLFTAVGWIPVAYSPLIALAGGLAMIGLAYNEGREIGFSSIVLMIALAGAVIGLVNGTDLFGGGFADAYAVSDYSIEMSIGSNGILDIARLALEAVQTMISMVLSILQLFVFGVPMLVQLGLPIALAVIVQCAVWVVTVIWFVTDLLPKLKS